MENSEDVHFLDVDFVNGDKRQGCEGQLSGSVDAAVTSQLWKCLKICDASNDGRSNLLGGTGTTCRDAVADAFEVVRSVRGLSDAHQLGYRRSMRAATSSCSSSLPSGAAARPFSTSTRNHSSWSIELANRSSATWSTVRPVW